MNENEFRRAYAYLQRNVVASDELKRRTKASLGLLEEAAERQTAAPVRSAGAQTRKRPFDRGFGKTVTVLPAWKAAVATCLAVLVGVGLLAGTGSFTRIQSAIAGNTFALAAYADEGGSSTPGRAIALSVEDFYPLRTSAGYYHDIENHTTDTSIVVAQRCYNFNLTCIGNNIDSIAYRIDGPDASFGSWTIPEDNQPNEVTDGTEFSIKYNTQNSSKLNRELVLSYLLGPEAKAEFDDLYKRDHDPARPESLSNEIDALLAQHDAIKLSNTKLTLTATFNDGSMQEKAYRFVPCGSFENAYEAYQNTKHSESPSGDKPDSPALFMLIEE